MRPRVLIVDDDEAVRTGLAANLDAEGYAVDTAASASEAIDQLDAHPVDLVLTDLIMEGMDGMSLLRLLVRNRPGLPVVVITGHGSAANAIEAVREGAADFIQKPARADEIAHRLRTVIEAHRLKQRLLRERDHARNQSQQDLAFQERARRTAALRRLADGLSQAMLPHLDHLRRDAPALLDALPVDHPQRALAETIERATHHLAPMGQRLRRYAQGERAGREPIDLAALVRDVLSGREFQALVSRAHDAQITSHLADGLPPVAGNPVRLRRALVDLLSFAMHGPVGESRSALRIRTERAPLPGRAGEDGVAIRIQESRRLSPMQAEILFEPFAVDRELNRSRPVDFALAQAALIIEAHGGTVSAEPSPEGTDYLIVLPVLNADDEAADSAEQPPEAAVRHVLLVDDHDGHRTEAAALLEALGHRVSAVASGQKAIERLAAKVDASEVPIDLVLLDLVLGDERDGVDVFHDIRSTHPTLPVVLAGGFGETARVVEAREMGVAAYLQKPFTEDALRRVLGQVPGA